MTNDIEFPIKTDGPRERSDGTPVIWENPDVPPVEKILETGDLEFECPYPQNPCDTTRIQIDSSVDDPRGAFVDALEASDGTHRCPDCNEPLYGLYGNGDGEGDV